MANVELLEPLRQEGGIFETETRLDLPESKA
jgi:hypothetical protein